MPDDPARMASPPGGKPAAPPPRDPTVEALAQRLGQPIGDPGAALAALTHKSYVNEHRGEGLEDNERLEFLGDAVLDLAVSQALMRAFPSAREGELSKIRAAVVDEAGLARMARELDLGSLLRLGRGEELTGGRQKSSLLADALEAVAAALYLGGGIEPVLRLLDRFLGEAFARAAAGTLDRDYKTQIQEWAQSRLKVAPRYRVVAEHGPEHLKTFDVALELRGEVVGRGTGRSKKDAEQAAARGALEALNERAAEGAAPAPTQPPEEAEPAPAEAPPPVAPAPLQVSEATGGAQAAGVARKPAEPPARKPRAKRAAAVRKRPVPAGTRGAGRAGVRKAKPSRKPRGR